MVLDDVAQRPRLVVVGPTKLNSDLLSRRDLHRIDQVAVPDRLEDRVGEPEGEDVLDRLLAQVVVDPVDGVFVEDFLHDLVELAR